MIKSDFHIHTNYCDGKHCAEDIVRCAISLGMSKIGFSGHSYVDFDDCCIDKNDLDNYISEINNLKLKYKDQIEIYLGLELDYYSNVDIKDFDYIIGSVHYVEVDGKYLSVDESSEDFSKNISKYFNNDVYAFCDKYFKLVGDIQNKTKCDIIGHFDLISKFNNNNVFFDPADKRYVNAWKNALAKTDFQKSIFEINSGAIQRGYKNDYYPSKEIRAYIQKNNGTFILSSDAHSKDALMFNFDKMQDMCEIENLSLIESPLK